MQIAFSTLIQELYKYAKNRQFQRAVVGLSGGLNSSLTLLMAVRTFSAKNVTALLLPEIGLTPADEITHAKALATHLGVAIHHQPINNFLVDYNFVHWDKTEEANENLKARIRATLLNLYAESTGAMLLGTADHSNLQLGLGTPDGEFAGALHPFGDLYKTDLIRLAEILGLPEELTKTPFSRHLKPNQTDLEDIGAPWEKVDEILRALDDFADQQTLIDKGANPLLVHRLARLREQNSALQSLFTIIPVSNRTLSIKKAREAEAKSA